MGGSLHWLRAWGEFFTPITGRSKAHAIKLRINLVTHLKIASRPLSVLLFNDALRISYLHFKFVLFDRLLQT